MDPGIAAPLRVQRMELVGPKQIASIAGYALRVGRIVALGLPLYFAVPLILTFFPLTSAYAEQLVALFVSPIKGAALAVWHYLPSLFYLFIIYLLARLGLRGADVFTAAIKRRELVIRGFDQDWADTTSTLLRVLVIFFAVAISYCS